MKKRQNRSRAEATFAFGETELSYSFRYGDSFHQTVADYCEIAPARKFVAHRDGSNLQFGALVMVIGLIAMAAQVYLSSPPAQSALWLTPGIALILLSFRKDHFRVFQASGAPVWIFEDRKAHKIIGEIELRRRKRLAEIYAPLNLNNEPRLELAKIEWLVLETVLTRDEADIQIAVIQAMVIEKAAAAEAAAAALQIFTPEALAI